MVQDHVVSANFLLALFCPKELDCQIRFLRYIPVGDTSLNSNIIKNPGPGTYTSPKTSATMEGSPSCSFGVSKRSDVDIEAKKVPGPGLYKIPSTIGEGPKALMKSRVGGGIYAESKTPGPGMYKVKSALDSPRQFTIKGRYNFGTAIVLNSDGTHEKIASQPDKDVPGPGSYNANHSLVTPSYSVTFGNGPGRPSPMKPGADKEPAPNAYRRDAKTPVMRKAPAFGFGVSSRPPT